MARSAKLPVTACPLPVAARVPPAAGRPSRRTVS